MNGKEYQKMKLSVIIPAANEWPTSVFTVRNIYEELRDRVDFEILYVDNSMLPDDKKERAYDQMCGLSRGYPWLKPLKYTDKLSHWQAKNLAVKESTGDFLWFCDAHCIISRDALFRMFNYMCCHHDTLNGTLHLPLTYHIMEYHKLIYKLTGDIQKGLVHYSFSAYREHDEPYQVPCMSTCGMMMSRSLYDELGGWPAELGIYGGGENFINFTLAVLGKTINILPGDALCHHGDKRGYSWNFDDHLRNKTIAAYMYGGVDFAKLFVKHHKGSPDQKERILNSVITNSSCIDHRRVIKSKQKLSIQEWWAKNI
jgi:glycosyltransferase involved in cell wall biosynthesis